MRDRKGQAIHYTYDFLNRLNTKAYPNSSSVNYTYDLLNRLAQAVDASGTYSFSYDNVGRLVSTGAQYAFLTGVLTNTYTYDGASNRTSLTDSQGVSNYTYGLRACSSAWCSLLISAGTTGRPPKQQR